MNAYDLIHNLHFHLQQTFDQYAMYSQGRLKSLAYILWLVIFSLPRGKTNK